MTEIIHFLGQHWLLSGGIGILLVLLLINELIERVMTKNQLDTQEVIQMINHQQAVLVDIRDQNSFESAHIVGSIHIPQDILEEKVSSINKYKTKPLILICAIGNLAPKLLQNLSSQGFEQVYYLAGGIVAWQKDNLPVLTRST